jgi:hypothetical protein
MDRRLREVVSNPKNEMSMRCHAAAYLILLESKNESDEFARELVREYADKYNLNVTQLEMRTHVRQNENTHG